jgi:SPP1 gp7 family putative phage head morphogenesis protein
MCGVDLCAAREVADDLLYDCYGIDVAKALDPLNQKDLLVIQRRLSKAVQTAAKGAEGRALKAALNKLNVDWSAMTAAQRSSVLGAAKAAAKTASAAAATSKKVENVLIKRGGLVVTGAKAAASKALRRGGLGISLNAVDQRILRTVAFNQAAFVRDELGNRADDMINIHARSIVEGGVKRGLGREAMMKELREKLGTFAATRSDNYWRTVGNYMTQTARSYGALSTYQEAGVTKYEIIAVLDKKTTTMCRFMNGQVHEVKNGIANIEQATPAAPLPWMYEGKNANGDPILYHKDPSGNRHTVANVDRSGAGNVGDTGKFSNTMSTAQLQNAGIDTPPFHGNCRTTMKAVLDGGGVVTGPAPKPTAPAAPKPTRAPRAPRTPTPLQAHVWARNVGDGMNSFVAGDGTGAAAKRGATKVRKGTRELLKKNYGLTARKNIASGAGENTMVVHPDTHPRMAKALATHSWDGTITYRRTVARNANNSIADLARRKDKTVAQVFRADETGQLRGSAPSTLSTEHSGLRTLVHEEIHGTSRAGWMTYQGFGIGMEEASTEILARRVMRDMLGFTQRATGRVPFSMPQVRRTLSGELRTFGGKGSYGNFINPLVEEIAAVLPTAEVEAAGFSEALARRIERACIASRQGNIIRTPTGHIKRFVSKLELTPEQEKKLLKRLAPRKASSSPLFKDRY